MQKAFLLTASHSKKLEKRYFDQNVLSIALNFYKIILS